MKHLLTYQDEKSDKFWEVEVKGKEMRVRYGKTGSEGQASVKKFTSVSAAETAAEKAIAEKVKKGYRNHEKTGGGAGAEDIETSIIASISSEQTF